MFPKAKKLKNHIYLDYAATTPVDGTVFKVMKPYLTEKFGNPSSLYKRGMDAQKALDEARKSIARQVNARSPEIIFTAGGTESCNLAVFGIAKKFKPAAKFKPHIIASKIEHHAVLNPLTALAGEGFSVSLIDVDKNGLIKIEDLFKAIRPQTILVSVMYANNEIGSIQPIAEIGKRLAKINIERLKKRQPTIIFHTDACQAAGSLDLNVNRLNVDLMSVNGSKIYGPKQTGFLFARTGVNLKPLIYGGGQENNLRSGTENVPGVVGLARALELAQKSRELENKRISGLQKYLISKLLKISGVCINGPDAGVRRLPNNINISIQGVEGEALMLYLDSYGIEVSTGSACTTGLADPSHVLLAIGSKPADANSSIRMSLGKLTTKQQLDYVTTIISGLIKELRRVNNFLF